MKVYISELDTDIISQLEDYELSSYEESEDIIVLPGGLGCFYDLARGIHDKKSIYLYNKDMFYSSLIKHLFCTYERGYEDNVPAQYMSIESDFSEIIKKLEEKKNGKVNNGEVSKLL